MPTEPEKPGLKELQAKTVRRYERWRLGSDRRYLEHVVARALASVSDPGQPDETDR